MAREQCTQARAFAILRSASQNRNVKTTRDCQRHRYQCQRRAPEPSPAFDDELSAIGSR